MKQAKFNIGQIVHHKLFDYRGVIYDVDPVFNGTEEWYRTVAKSSPPKNEPWYRVLVDKASHDTYVAEQNLESCSELFPIRHPMLNQYFESFIDGRYFQNQTNN